MIQPRWSILSRRVIITAKALYHGISLVGLTEDAKKLWAWLCGAIAPAILGIEQVRAWLMDGANYLLIMEAIGDYGPWFTGPLFLLVLTKRAYRRGLPEVPEAEGLAEPEEETNPVQPIPKIIDDQLVFRGLASQQQEVLVYRDKQADDYEYGSLVMEAEVYALEDELTQLGLRLPETLMEQAKLLGLMKTGNLTKARLDFPRIRAPY